MSDHKPSFRKELIKKRLGKLAANKLSLLGACIFIFMVAISVFAPLLTQYSPSDINLDMISLAPSESHIFGTDRLGRDMLSQILYGGRVSIYVGIFGAITSTIVGTTLGCGAGFFGGMVDKILLKISEVCHSFPQMLLIMILAGIMGQNVNNLIIIFAFTGWMTTFRIVRNQVVSEKEETYVATCKALGLSSTAIMLTQILPNIISPILVSMSVNTANFILSETGLSFLGLGVPITTPTWGNIMNAAKDLEVLTNQWWIWLFPSLTISAFVLAVNFLGDGLRDVLDPKS